MALESVILRNWQTHCKRTLQLDPRVTTIIGPTDAGKSALLRAIRWVCLNQFDGPADSFIAWDTAFAKVTLKVDGHEIVRRKGDVNSYELDGQEFRAFGSEKVPDPITNLLQLDTIHFQSQLDAHFWLSASPGQVSRELNQIISLEIIDNALAAVASAQRQTSSVHSVCLDRIETARQQSKDLAWTAPADEALSELERLAAVRDSLDARRASILRRTEEAAKHGQTVKRLKIVSLASNSVVTTGETAQTLAQNVARLRKLLKSAEHARKLARIAVPELPDPQTAKDLRERQQGLANALSNIQKTKDTLCHHQTQLAAVQKLLQEGTKGLCPTCGKPMSSPSSARTST